MNAEDELKNLIHQTMLSNTSEFWIEEFKREIDKLKNSSVNTKEVEYWLDYLKRDPDNATKELNNKLISYRKQVLGF